MSNFTTVPDETILEMKRLKKRIVEITEDEMQFNDLSSDSIIERIDCKDELFNLIDSL